MKTWIIDPALTPDGRGTGCYDVHENTEHGRFVATVDHERDGILIASAPELLAAATAALNLLTDPDASEFDADRVERTLRAAIEKAGGAP